MAAEQLPKPASTPPPGTANAALIGGLTQGGMVCNGTVIGTGVSSNRFLNTGWAPPGVGQSWTIFQIREYNTFGNLVLCVRDINTNSFRCFTNGVAGPNNWWLRGAG